MTGKAAQGDETSGRETTNEERVFGKTQGQVERKQAGGAASRATPGRAVGVYERPAQRRARVSLPVLVILILASLVSLVLSVRFLF